VPFQQAITIHLGFAGGQRFLGPNLTSSVAEAPQTFELTSISLKAIRD